jgi:hypothetical protein
MRFWTLLAPHPKIFARERLAKLRSNFALVGVMKNIFEKINELIEYPEKGILSKDIVQYEHQRFNR